MIQRIVPCAVGLPAVGKGAGVPNFFWGHYRSDRSSCIEDFCERAGNEYKKQRDYITQQEHQHTTLKKEQGEAR